MAQPAITAIAPFFIVTNVDQTVAFYSKLGFAFELQDPNGYILFFGRPK